VRENLLIFEPNVQPRVHGLEMCTVHSSKPGLGFRLPHL
jgi:hypothetical protein